MLGGLTRRQRKAQAMWQCYVWHTEEVISSHCNVAVPPQYSIVKMISSIEFLLKYQSVTWMLLVWWCHLMPKVKAPHHDEAGKPEKERKCWQSNKWIRTWIKCNMFIYAHYWHLYIISLIPRLPGHLNNLDIQECLCLSGRTPGMWTHMLNNAH